MCLGERGIINGTRPERKFLVNLIVLSDNFSTTSDSHLMPTDNPDNWYLKKHENGEVFGPIPLERIREWARSAQVNSQDMLSNDNVIWNQAPMIPQMEMDWLVEVNEDLLYGPTTAETLLEFHQLGEISSETTIINCRTAESLLLGEAGFYSAPEREPEEEQIPAAPLMKMLHKSGRGTLRVNLQSRVRELEVALLEKRLKLMEAEHSILRLEAKIKILENRIRDFSGFKSS